MDKTITFTVPAPDFETAALIEDMLKRNGIAYSAEMVAVEEKGNLNGSKVKRRKTRVMLTQDMWLRIKKALGDYPDASDPDIVRLTGVNVSSSTVNRIRHGQSTLCKKNAGRKFDWSKV